MRKLPFIGLALLTAVALSSCRQDVPAATPMPDAVQTATPDEAPATPTPEPAVAETVSGEAMVESIQIVLLESFPVQVHVQVRGVLPDGCTRLDEVGTRRDSNAFQVRLTTRRDAEAMCTTAVVPFEETVPLPIVGLDAGIYTVAVNGIGGSFTLADDNRLTPETEGTTPTPEAAETGSGVIGGRIWHDLCPAIAESEIGAGFTPPAGCVVTADGAAIQANAVMEEGEPGIQAVVVNLGQGACPATGLDTAVTTADGIYTFTNLTPGTYCVSIDPLAAANSDILPPGGWTFPSDGSGNTTVALAEGESSEVNFGWDYKFLPLPEVDLATCTKSIEFVDDLTIPDDTVVPPGQEFTKTWRLRNNGTCPWTTEYSLVFVGGDELPGPQSVPLSRPVAPGEPVDLSVTFTAPAVPGAYRSNWQISDAAGAPFGINGIIGDAFWLQIVVQEGAATPVPGSGAIGGMVWSDLCRRLADGTPAGGCVETAQGSGVYRADGAFNNNESRMSGVTVTLSRGACPEDSVIRAANVISTTVTDQQGLYRFTDLDADTYCISIDAFSSENVNLLIPGDWTYPAAGTGRFGIRLAPNVERLNVDFGWEHYD